MTLPVHLYPDFVELSIQKYLSEKWAATCGYPVYWGDDAEADPDGAQTPAATTIALASNGAALPQATINVVSTAGFPAAGTLSVATGSGPATVNYTGTTSTAFTGCTGGAGTLATGGAVSVTPAMRWALFRMGVDNTGAGFSSSCQVDFKARIGTRGQQATTGARYSLAVKAMIRGFIVALSPYNQSFKVYDFTTPASPTETRGRLQFEDHRGAFGGIGNAREMPTVGNVRHYVLPLDVRHLQDGFGRPGRLFY